MSKDTALSVYRAAKPQRCSGDALRGMVQLANEDEPRHFGDPGDPGAEEISIGKRRVEGPEQISGTVWREEARIERVGIVDLDQER